MVGRAGRREWLTLAVLCLPLMLVTMDVSVLFFAVPQIAADLRPSAVQVLWILDVYGFVLAGLLLTMGSVADRVGRRRTLLIGAVAFGGASALAAYAPGPGWLIAARAVLGVGGSTLMPSTLAIVRDVFVDPGDRAKAVGVWSAVMAGGVGIGPVVSGVLLEHFWWGSVFLINLPVLAAFLAVAARMLPESRDVSARVDLTSAVLSLLAVLPMVHALKDLAAHGRSWPVLGYAALGLGAGIAFVRRQRRIATPMVDLALFRRPGLGASVGVQVIAMFGVMGNAVVLTQYLQSVLGLSALAAALWSLAPSVVVGGAAPGAAVLARRLGRPHVIAGGCLLAAAGFGLLLLAGAHSSVWTVLLAATPIAAGLVSVTTLVTEYAIGVAPPQRTGSVSALVETAGELGGALGMAVLGSVLAAAYGSSVRAALPAGLAPETVATVADSLPTAAVAAAAMGGPTGEAVLDVARAAYASGMHAAALVAAAVVMLGAWVSLAALPRRADGSTAPVCAGQPAGESAEASPGPARGPR
ncbi:MAG: MFS transporter [Dermatophilaceae bacterium]